MQLTCITLTQLTCNSAAAPTRHRTTVASLVYPPSYTHPIESLLIVTFLLPSYRATLCLLSSVQPQTH